MRGPAIGQLGNARPRVADDDDDDGCNTAPHDAGQPVSVRTGEHAQGWRDLNEHARARFQRIAAVLADGAVRTQDEITRALRRDGWTQGNIFSDLTRMVDRGLLRIDTDGRNNGYRLAVHAEQRVEDHRRLDAALQEILRFGRACGMEELYREARRRGVLVDRPKVQAWLDEMVRTGRVECSLPPEPQNDEQSVLGKFVSALRGDRAASAEVQARLAGFTPLPSTEPKYSLVK